MASKQPISEVVIFFCPNSDDSASAATEIRPQQAESASSDSGTSCSTTDTPSQVRKISLQLKSLSSWLQLQQHVNQQLKHASIDFGNPKELVHRDLKPRYYRLDAKQISAFGSSTQALRSWLSAPTSNQLEATSTEKLLPIALLVTITFEDATRMNWATRHCNDLLGLKLMMVGKAEYSKAVNATLGGAYATLQRAGWARLYARKTLALARASGDTSLELRAKIYLKICKIISILHPSYAKRRVFQDQVHGVTTKTDTNVLASEAHKPSQEEHERLTIELDGLLLKASEEGEDELVGMIKYAKFRLESAGGSQRNNG